MAVAPAAVNQGGALVYTGGDFIYAFQGNVTTAFWRYFISGNSWATMTAAPATVGDGGALVYTGGDFIYAFQGNVTTAFWRTSLLPAPLFLDWQSWMR
jgi:outer membrane protein assembly factor BamB